MIFPYRTVSDPAATQNFEALQKLDILNLTAEGVLQLAATGAKRQIAFGSSSVTFTAATFSAGTIVTHNLGRTPLLALGINNTANGIFFAYDSKTLTTVRFFGFAASALTATFTFDWLAIG